MTEKTKDTPVILKNARFQGWSSLKGHVWNWIAIYNGGFLLLGFVVMNLPERCHYTVPIVTSQKALLWSHQEGPSVVVKHTCQLTLFLIFTFQNENCTQTYRHFVFKKMCYQLLTVKTKVHLNYLFQKTCMPILDLPPIFFVPQDIELLLKNLLCGLKKSNASVSLGKRGDFVLWSTSFES